MNERRRWPRRAVPDREVTIISITDIVTTITIRIIISSSPTATITTIRIIAIISSSNILIVYIHIYMYYTRISY